MWPNPQETVELATFTEEILNGKLHFFGQRLIAAIVIGRSILWLWVGYFIYFEFTPMFLLDVFMFFN